MIRNIMSDRTIAHRPAVARHSVPFQRISALQILLRYGAGLPAVGLVDGHLAACTAEVRSSPATRRPDGRTEGQAENRILSCKFPTDSAL